MTDYTPTTEDIAALDEALRDVGPAAGRWLADHNRKIAAEALRALAGEMEADLATQEKSTGQIFDYTHPRCIELRGLRARADRIEQGGES